MKSTILALLLAFAAPLQNLPPSTPRDGAKQLIDNNRVAVWDVTLEKGKPTAMHEHRYNMVGINLTDATLKVVNVSWPGLHPDFPKGRVDLGAEGVGRQPGSHQY